jgi:hypothetical protein
MRDYGIGLCVSLPPDLASSQMKLIGLHRSGGFAIERTILVPSLTTTSDPTCEFA